MPVVQLALVTLRGLPGGERVRADLPGHFPAYADPERCGQIVNRLVANALQHAPGTEVTVRLYAGRGAPVGPPGGAGRRAGHPPGGAGQGLGALLPGPGATIAEGPRGAGIGLALVKATAEAQAGEVGAWSGAGRGSRFWVDLPVAPPGERTGDDDGYVMRSGGHVAREQIRGEYDAGTAMEPDTSRGCFKYGGAAPWPWPRPERRWGRWRRRRCSGAGWRPGAGVAQAYDEWCDTDPLLLVITPQGNIVPVFYMTGRRCRWGLALLGLLSMSYTAVPAEGAGRRSP